MLVGHRDPKRIETRKQNKKERYKINTHDHCHEGFNATLFILFLALLLFIHLGHWEAIAGLVYGELMPGTAYGFEP